MFFSGIWPIKSTLKRLGWWFGLWFCWEEPGDFLPSKKQIGFHRWERKNMIATSQEHQMGLKDPPGLGAGQLCKRDATGCWNGDRPISRGSPRRDPKWDGHAGILYLHVLPGWYMAKNPATTHWKYENLGNGETRAVYALFHQLILKLGCPFLSIPNVLISDSYGVSALFSSSYGGFHKWG